MEFNVRQTLQNWGEYLKSLDSKQRVPAAVAIGREHYLRHTRFWNILLVIFLTLFLVRCHSFESKKHPGLLVVLGKVQTSNVPVYFTALGSVIPTYTVTVRTQINGQLLRVLFREGQMVKAGDLLAQIDPRLYEAQLVQYQGQLARDQALLANAKVDQKRYQTLWKQDSVAKQTLDTQLSLVQQDEGIVKIDEGLIQSTKVNLLYTNITAPIDGRIGLRLVDPGNYVQTSDVAGIAVINMLNPISVVFTLPEDNVPAVLEQLHAGKTLTVETYDRLQNKLLATGTLLTIDNQIDPTTGTVKLKASFNNENNLLFPNQFVNVKLLVTTIENATIVPTAAIQHGVQNTFVYLAKNDDKVSIQPIVVGMTSGENTVVTSGLTAGQDVVVDGTDKLTDGAEISTSNSDKTNGKSQRSHKK